MIPDIDSAISTDAAVARIITSARSVLDAATLARLTAAADADRATLPQGVGGYETVPRISVRATEGAELLDVLRVVIAGVRAGCELELSLSFPLCETLHRGLVASGTAVRVESAERWGSRLGADGRHARIVGPEISRRGTLARTSSRLGAATAWLVSACAVDVDGSSELQELLAIRCERMAS